MLDIFINIEHRTSNIEHRMIKKESYGMLILSGRDGSPSRPSAPSAARSESTPYLFRYFV
jgi:hypothetical protein